MRFLFAALIALSVSCGPRPVLTNDLCCSPTRIPPGFGFVGSYATDGGTTQVQVIAGPSGSVTITFLRGGDQVVETYGTTSR